MAAQFADDVDRTFGIPHAGASRPIDVLVGTPNKLLEMARGRRWDHVKDETDKTDKQLAAVLSGSRNETSSKGREPEMGLANVERSLSTKQISFSVALSIPRTDDG